MNKQVVDETIRALLAMKNAGLVAITTPRGPDNFATQWMEMKNEDGTPFFNIIHLTTICDRCRLLPTSAEQLKCNHNWIPTYKSAAKQRRNADIARATGSESITMQEDCGIVVSHLEGYVFQPDQLKRVFDLGNPELRFSDDQYKPPRIYVFSDPNASGASNTTVQSGFWVPPRSLSTGGGHDRFVFLGLDVENTKGIADKERLILSHIETIRSMPTYADVPIIFVPERNTGDYGYWGQEAVSKLSSVVTFEEKPGIPGVWISDMTKGSYVNTMQRMMDSGQICWSTKLFTNSVDYVSRRRVGYENAKKTNVEIVHRSLMMEMCGLRSEKRKITGKFGNNQDDQAITMMMGPDWSRIIENKFDDRYAKYRKLVWVNRPISYGL